MSSNTDEKPIPSTWETEYLIKSEAVPDCLNPILKTVLTIGKSLILIRRLDSFMVRDQIYFSNSLIDHFIFYSRVVTDGEVASLSTRISLRIFHNGN